MNATITTSKGTIVIALDPAAAPETCKNFQRYADAGFYDNTIFHRVIPGFMIQGGGFTADMQQKDTEGNVRNEANNGLVNNTGTIAMARTPDPHSATAQFFVNLSDNEFLNFQNESDAGFGYCVFGEVSDGMSVVNEIAKAQTGNHGHHGDVPVEAIVIESISVTVSA